jgi:hypothetical protein
MMSAAATKGSMLFWQEAVRDGHSDSTAATVNCAVRCAALRIATAGARF